MFHDSQGKQPVKTSLREPLPPSGLVNLNPLVGSRTLFYQVLACLEESTDEKRIKGQIDQLQYMDPARISDSNKLIEQLYKKTGETGTVPRYLVLRNYLMFRCNYSIVVVFYKENVLIF